MNLLSDSVHTTDIICSLELYDFRSYPRFFEKTIAYQLGQ